MARIASHHSRRCLAPRASFHAARPGEPSAIQYRPTHWERGGKLAGRTCLRGLLAEYKRSLRQTEAPYVLKLDADTLVLNPATLNTLILQGVDYGTHSTP